ncbi:hypothetical protein MFRU_006g03820 [Monilinia fructicola]|nr:hypothetical protein MFRU_006g03820 [Monilinia fructicola]
MALFTVLDVPSHFSAVNKCNPSHRSEVRDHLNKQDIGQRCHEHDKQETGLECNGCTCIMYAYLVNSWVMIMNDFGSSLVHTFWKIPAQISFAGITISLIYSGEIPAGPTHSVYIVPICQRLALSAGIHHAEGQQ